MGDCENLTREEWVTVDGRRVRIQIAPPACTLDNQPTDAPLRLPVLFLHGLGCTGDVWLPTVHEMATRGLTCPILAPDLPGYGESPAPDEAMSMVELAAWSRRLLDTCCLQRVHVAGNSMGCQVALALARTAPERVGALVLQGATTGVRYLPPWRYVAGLLADAAHESIPYNIKLLHMYAQMGPVRYLETARKMMEDDPWESLADIHAPVLVIRGGHDSIVPDDVARRLAAALPNAVYMPLDSAAHAIEFNNPVEFTEALMTFFHRAEETLFDSRQKIGSGILPPGKFRTSRK